MGQGKWRTVGAGSANVADGKSATRDFHGCRAFEAIWEDLTDRERQRILPGTKRALSYFEESVSEAQKNFR